MATSQGRPGTLEAAKGREQTLHGPWRTPAHTLAGLVASGAGSESCVVWCHGAMETCQ